MSNDLIDKWAIIKQVGFIFHDLQKVIEGMRTVYGVEPDRIITHLPEEGNKYCGKNVDVDVEIIIYSFSNIDLEFVCPRSNNNVWADYLEKHGEGLHHIRFTTPTYEGIINEMKAKNIGVTQEGLSMKGLPGVKWGYLDSEDTIGFTIEIFNEPLNIKRLKATGRSFEEITLTGEIKMNNKTAKKWNNISQIGFVCPNLEKVKHGMRMLFGAEPDRVIPHMPNEGNMYYGEPTETDAEILIYSFANVDLEFICPRRDNNIWHKHLEMHGEYLHHVCFTTDSYDDVVDEMQQKGIAVSQEGISFSGLPGVRWGYFDSMDTLGFIFEIIYEPEVVS